MSVQQSPLTYEGILEMFRETGERMKETERIIQGIAQRQAETAEQMKETDRKMQETDRIIQETALRQAETDRIVKATSRDIGKLGSRIGDIIENMVGGGNIVAQFRALGHHVIAHSRNKTFGGPEDDDSGQIDLFLENGDIAILVEVKTTLKNDDILDHLERMEKYRNWINANGGDKKRYLGAVAGAVVEENVVKFAQKKGFYVIVQSGVAFEIIAPPQGFKAKEW